MSAPVGSRGGGRNQNVIINSTVTRPSNRSDATKAAAPAVSTAARAPAASKTPPARLKVIVRRLAPGLSEAEFKTAIGPDWLVGRGRTDWLNYQPGKASKDTSKLSRPSRAYLNLTSQEHVTTFAEHVRNTSFEDAANTFTNPCLVGPPVLELAPNPRVPQGRRRVDARAGTIDQDPEFMAFLESLANPDAPKHELEEGSANAPLQEKGVKVTTTPLVQHLRDKKARKAKDAEVAKVAKAAKQAEVKALTKVKEPIAVKADEDKKPAKEGRKTRDATKEAVKILKQQAEKNTPAPAASPSIATRQEAAKPADRPAARPPRERGSAVAAARILQRDLGLNPTTANRRVKATAGKADNKDSTSAGAPASKSAKDTKTSTPAGPASDTTTAAPAPVMLLKKSDAKSAATPSNSPADTPAALPAAAPGPGTKQAPATSNRAQGQRRPGPGPSAGARHAFIKHANPSQGITEDLLKSALANYGEVKHLEIDKRKGFAYAEFQSFEGLKSAMAAGTIKVAQGGVLVLERKDPKGISTSQVKAGTSGSASTENTGNAAMNATSPGASGASATDGRGASQGRNGGGRGTFGRRGGRAAAAAAKAAGSTDAGENAKNGSVIPGKAETSAVLAASTAPKAA